MIICVCKFRRGENDKMIHETNMVWFDLQSSSHSVEGEIISNGRGEMYFRSAAFNDMFSSAHGWEKLP